MRTAAGLSFGRWTLAASILAASSVGCSAIFSDDLADNGAAQPSAGAAGFGGRAGSAGGGAAGNGGRAGASFGGAAGGGGSAGSSGSSAGTAGSATGSAGQPQAGQGGASPAGGNGGANAGTAGSAGTTGGTGGAQAGAAGAGAGGANAGTGGAAGSGAGGAAGSGATAGAGGAAGSGATAGTGGAAGSGAGAGGAAGTNGCPQLPLDPPPAVPSCGNGVVESGEECDVGGGTADDGCSPLCQLTCQNGVRVGRSCYAVSANTFRGEQVFVTPNTVGVSTGNPFLADFGDNEACAHLPGPTSHMAMLNRKGERAALQESGAFAAHLASGVAGSKNGSAWVALGYRWLLGGEVTDPSRWSWTEGGVVDASLWAGGYPKVDGSGPGGGFGEPDGCGSINGALAYENHDCDALRRPVLCEREPACALRAGPSAPWQIGYQGENGHCYLRLAQQTSYENALAACKALGAHLAAFETLDELAALPGIASGLGDVWIGARRNTCAKQGQQNAFVWLTNGAIVPTGAEDPGYWSPNEPNDTQGNENCAQLTRSHGLNDATCSSGFRALCERDY